MTKQFLKVNGGDLVPAAKIKRIRAVTDKDRASLAGLGKQVDPTKYNARLDYAEAGSYATETIDELAMQCSLVEIANDVFVIGANVVTARDLTQDDRDTFEAKLGRAMPDGFVSQVRTKAGNVLSTVAAETVMHRLAHPYRPAPPETAPEESAPEHTADV